ncbi:MAG TPA: carotenoid oxygenase family protein [Solirubrobacteraceae bacterium]|nr:carotenoid oxygenase family protein [Solirubrobacteraceae bacterium]
MAPVSAPTTTPSCTPVATGAPALGFTTLEEQHVIDDLPVRGELPPWLAGSLLRTGPARFETGSRQMRHWFDGLAMLHRFTIDGGLVSYGGRYLEGRSYRAARERGTIAYGEFATDPCRSIFRRVQSAFHPGGAFTDNANVNVTRLGERFIAMTETPMPVQFDPHTLQTVGVRPFDTPGELTTAHPHLDRRDGAMLNYAASLGPRSSYRFFRVRADSEKPELIAKVPVREPAYMHSFGLTERYLVLAEFPFVVNPLDLALARRPYIENYRWKPQRGTRFTLVDRSSGEAVGGLRGEACFAFHHVNAFHEGDQVVVDLCAYPDPGIVEDLYLERLRAGKPLAKAELVRFRLDPQAGTVSRERLVEDDLELPRINYGRCNERPYRYTWGLSAGPSGFLERIVKVDTEQRTVRSWQQAGLYPGEPVFVARPGAEAEDDGVLLSVVLDAEAASSMLLVIDAAGLEELARASLPHHIPFGFHGQFERSVTG